MDEQQIISYLPLVRKIAEGIRFGTLPYCMDTDDLIQCGVIGLLSALGNYDPGKGKFTSYAYPKIRGAMIDEIRRLRWGRRNKDRSVMQSLDAPIGNDSTLADLIPDNIQRLDYIELSDMIDRLEYCAKTVIKHYYWQELSQLQIARGLGLSEGRISQIRSRALRQLKDAL